MYGKDLEKNLKGELKGKLETIVLHLLYLPAEFDAHMLRKAMKVGFCKIFLFYTKVIVHQKFVPDCLFLNNFF